MALKAALKAGLKVGMVDELNEYLLLLFADPSDGMTELDLLLASEIRIIRRPVLV